MNAPDKLPELASSAKKSIPYFDAADDETTFSYRNRAALFTGISSPAKVVKGLFGSLWIQVESPLHGGFDRFSEHLERFSGRSRETIDAHSHAPFFMAFMSSDEVGAARELMVDGNGRGIARVFKLRPKGVFRARPAICLECVREDRQEHLFAWHHRVHQVTALKLCPHHGTPVVEVCCACDSPLDFSEVPSLRCRNCEAAFEHPVVALSAEESARNLILGQFVLSAYRGAYYEIDGPLRWATIQRRTEEIAAAQSLDHERDLSRVVAGRIGMNVLQSADLDPFDGPFVNWPENFGHGGRLNADPIANLILMSALFDSPPEFIAAAMKIADSRSPIRGAKRPRARIKRSLPLSLSEAKQRMQEVKKQMGPVRNQYLFLRAVDREFSMISRMDPRWLEEHLVG